MSNKYLRQLPEGKTAVDVYDVIEAFQVTCPAVQHALKKLLCTGIRGHKNAMTDLHEAGQSIERAIALENERMQTCRT